LREHPRYGVGFVEVGGWDSHVGQGKASSGLAPAFQRLGEGLAELAGALGPEWQRTVVVVMSEFGRTFRENGSRGTDHGHGSKMWLLGGDIRGGRIVGEQTALALGRLHQDRDLPVLNEYRAVIGGLLADRFGLRAAQVAQVFPGVDVRAGAALA
jgi:uncharacterized protein (DUF1501 family)